MELKENLIFLAFVPFDFLKNTNSKISNEYALSKETANLHTQLTELSRDGTQK